MLTRADAAHFILEIKRTSYKLNPWEQGFIESISDHRAVLPLSEKQANCLKKIHEKATDVKKERLNVRNV